MNIFKSLFKEAGVKDVITLFHSASNPASMRVHTMLKQAAANSVATATEDQASDHTKQSKVGRTDFELDVVEVPPTRDQLSSILEYLGPSNAGTVIKDATGTSDALKRFAASTNVFQLPVTVDWNHGRAVVGDNESEILKLIRTSKESEKP